MSVNIYTLEQIYIKNNITFNLLTSNFFYFLKYYVLNKKYKYIHTHVRSSSVQWSKLDAKQTWITIIKDSLYSLLMKPRRGQTSYLRHCQPFQNAFERSFTHVWPYNRWTTIQSRYSMTIDVFVYYIMNQERYIMYCLNCQLPWNLQSSSNIKSGSGWVIWLHSICRLPFAFHNWMV